ncbi:MAG TPA: O-methyltransferase [Candidatus Dormibacteraeota bacterium]|jgi:predicted O-methyltransferase YrrM|nr:O-methyltransferase [Candidatus Dormibacteraeota bacterium]
MENEVWTKVDEYFADMIGEDQALKTAVAESERAGLPAIAVTASQGKLLMLTAQMVGARKILEVGTLGGYSTIWLARGLAAGGKLITLEYEKKHADVAQKNIARAGLEGQVEVRVGDATKTMPELVAEGTGPFDLIFLDANKDGYPIYYDWSLKLSRKGTVIIADNVVRDGGVADPENKDASIKGIQRLKEIVAADRRVNATAIQTVGSKGYDGFAMMIVESA